MNLNLWGSLKAVVRRQQHVMRTPFHLLINEPESPLLREYEKDEK
jgi:hypothetical protein